jgi:signal transduction histidine kinase
MVLHRKLTAKRRMKLDAQKDKALAETLLRIATTLNTTLEQDRVLALILEQLAYVVQYDNASIMLLEGESLHAVARRSIHQPESPFLSVRIGKLLHVREVIENKHAVVIRDTCTDSRWMYRQGSETIRCWLGVPLLVQDRTIGMLNLSNSVPDSYTAHHIQVTVAFAAHAAMAIENARLYTQARQQIEERERTQAALCQSEARLQERVLELQHAKAAEQKQRERAELLLAEQMRIESELQEERRLLAHRVEERSSELKAANEKLIAALQTKDEFLAIVSHELRTPLNAILLQTELMQTGIYGVPDERYSRGLTRVEHSARHLLSLINDILDIAKFESSRIELDLRPVSIPMICHDSLQLIVGAAQKKQIEVVQNFDQAVDVVDGDERRLIQILVNLLSNAVKFTPDGGKVGLDVRGDAKQRLVHLMVWDTGIGIAKKDMLRLFQPFVQLDTRLSRQYEGTGLGLSLVERLTKLHGGTVALESEVGNGSRFTVSIPWTPPTNLRYCSR